MKQVNPMVAAEVPHAEWIPLLDMAVPEVFELRLSSHWTAPSRADSCDVDTTAMVGLGGSVMPRPGRPL